LAQAIQPQVSVQPLIVCLPFGVSASRYIRRFRDHVRRSCAGDLNISFRR